MVVAVDDPWRTPRNPCKPTRDEERRKGVSGPSPGARLPLIEDIRGDCAGHEDESHPSSESAREQQQGEQTMIFSVGGRTRPGSRRAN